MGVCFFSYPSNHPFLFLRFLSAETQAQKNCSVAKHQHLTGSPWSTPLPVESAFTAPHDPTELDQSAEKSWLWSNLCYERKGGKNTGLIRLQAYVGTDFTNHQDCGGWSGMFFLSWLFPLLPLSIPASLFLEDIKCGQKCWVKKVLTAILMGDRHMWPRRGKYAT